MNSNKRIEITFTFDAFVREFSSDLGDNASAKISQTTGIKVQSETMPKHDPPPNIENTRIDGLSICISMNMNTIHVLVMIF